MKRMICLLILAVYTHFPLMAISAVSPVAGGYQVSYDIYLAKGTSNGNDIEDTFIFEWNDSGDFAVSPGFVIAGQGSTVLTHIIDFEPTFALVMGWGAAIPGVGDEKNHLFTLTNSSFAALVSGKKWSEAFPGAPPVPRTGHNAMIGLIQAAASGDVDALDAVTEFVQREAGPAAFNPAGRFRIVEWTVATLIDDVCSIEATCANASAKRTCSSIWNPFRYNVMITMVTTTGAASNCAPMAMTAYTSTSKFFATRPTAAAPTGGCKWAGKFINGTMTYNFFCTICGPETGAGASAACADDLPVELMEFSVDFADDDLEGDTEG